MAETQVYTPDPQEEAERKARMEARQEKAKTEAFRVQALTLAVQAAKPDALAPAIVAKAKVFEHYFATGEVIDPQAFTQLTNDVLAAANAQQQRHDSVFEQ